jgi:hypothetical protein
MPSVVIDRVKVLESYDGAAPEVTTADIVDATAAGRALLTTVTNVSTGNIVVSGAGSPLINGPLSQTGTTNGRASYSDPSFESTVLIFWDNSRWVISESIDEYYESTDDVITPDLVATWTMVGLGSAPAPTVTAETRETLITASQITDATAAGLDLLTAEDAEAQVELLGAAPKRLCTVDHDTPGTFSIPHFTSVVFAWPIVQQETNVYNTDTGVFTIPERGVFSMQINIIGEGDPVNAGAVILNKNGNGFMGLEWLTRGDGRAYVSGDIIFDADANDEITVSSFISASPDGIVLLDEYFSSFNKIYLFKL